MSAEAFARTNGFSTQRLRYWKMRLTKVETQSFVSVRLPMAMEPVAVATTMTRNCIEIVCDVVVLRVREDLDVEHLARITMALSSARARRC